MFWVWVLCGVLLGVYVWCVGDDVQFGDVVVCVGMIIGVVQVGLLVVVGCEWVLVYFCLWLLVMVVGGELVDILWILGNGQVYDVNFYVLVVVGWDVCVEVNWVGIVSNDFMEFGEIVEGQFNWVEVVVIVGGVGGVVVEVVRLVFFEFGEMEVVWVVMYLGFVQGFGQFGCDGVLIFLLLVNLVSVLVVFEVMVWLLIWLLLGKWYLM